MKKVLLAIWFLCLTVSTMAQAPQPSHNNLRNDWFVQVGLDAALQNPYGYHFGDVLQNGVSMGLDAAAGRWFTPELGMRAKVNWENGLIDSKADWLAPFHQPGVNHSRGGYFSFVGDVQLDVHNIIWGYKADRIWNLQVYPRAGLIYNFGVSKGSPLLGIGLGNTFRVGKKVKLYLDATYQLVSSGFTGDPSTNTGTGTNANAFLNIDAGVQIDLGGSNLDLPRNEQTAREEGTVNRFLDGWFVQLGLDQTLQKPFNKSFSGSFTKGRSYGFDAAVGRRFSSEIALRGRLNWENGFPLFRNKDLVWIAPSDGSNMDKGGYLALCMDVLLSAKHIVLGYKPDAHWDMYVFPRLGLGFNLAIGSASPLVGIGLGGSYRFNKRWSLYADAAFQGITSEFFGDVATTGMGVPTKFNGFIDTHLGVQLDL